MVRLFERLGDLLLDILTAWASVLFVSGYIVASYVVCIYFFGPLLGILVATAFLLALQD